MTRDEATGIAAEALGHLLVRACRDDGLAHALNDVWQSVVLGLNGPRLEEAVRVLHWPEQGDMICRRRLGTGWEVEEEVRTQRIRDAEETARQETARREKETVLEGGEEGADPDPHDDGFYEDFYEEEGD